MSDAGKAKAQPIDFKSRLSKALVTVKKLRSRLEQIETASHEPIAIVGMGCRLPGSSNDEASFWQMLKNGVDAVTDFPRDRANADRWYDPNPEVPGKAYIMKAGYIDSVDRFDPTLFGISPREAIGMDPQQRLAMEVAWETLENAGLSQESLAGSRTGVYMGASTSDYVRMRQQYGLPEDVDAYNMLGELSFIAGRISYTFGFHGPAEMIDTACSSSLVATHRAVQGLRRREIDFALTGGVNLILSPFGYVLLSKTSAVSPNGRCATFDAKADGYTRGEGCGMIALERLSDAVANRHNVLALIRGSAINHDGRSSGLTVPNNAAQQAVIRDAVADAQIDPHAIDFIEAHGTGTPLGDPIELRALEAVLGAGRDKDAPMLIGSVKTNFGHLEAAAGIAGLLKLVVSLRAKEIPAHLHFKTPNPNVDWNQLHIEVANTHRPWPSRGERAGGLSSFGASGTNAHLILSEAPQRPTPTADIERPQHMLTLTAKTAAALDALAKRFADGVPDDARIEDVCFSANTGRARLPHRLAVAADSVETLKAQLAKHAAGRPAKSVVRGQVTSRNRSKITFLFTGQGAQTIGMGKDLYDSEPVFRDALDKCAAASDLPAPLLEVIYPESGESALDDTGYAQPALFAIEYALCELWRSWGVKPRAVMGHSVGELGAAVAAGVMSVEDGLKLIAARGQLMQALPRGGAMCQIAVDEARALEEIAGYEGKVSIAGINGPTDVVISGDEDAVNAIATKLDGEGLSARKLKVSHAFHSHHMDPMLDAFEEVVASVTLNAPRIPLISNLTGKVVEADRITTPRYWRDHVRGAVRFLDGMQTLNAQGSSTFLEVGPKRTLTGLGKKCLPDEDSTWIASMRSKGDDHRHMLLALGEVYALGVEVNWAGVHAGESAQYVPLPLYPFQRDRYWYDAYEDDGPRRQAKSKGAPAHPLLGERQRSPMIAFDARLTPDQLPWLEARGDKRVAGAGAFCEVADAAARSAFGEAEYTLTDVTIEEPLVLPDDDPVSLQVVLTPDPEGGGRFEVHSQTDVEASRDLPWIRHATGRARRSGEQAVAAALTDGLPVITVPEDEAPYRVHPAALDAALRLLGDEPVVHVGSYRASRIASGELSAKVSEDQVRLLDAEGAEVVAFSGVKQAPFRHAALHRPRHDRLRDAMYELAWQPRPRQMATPEHAGRKTVIFADSGGFADALAEALEAAGESCVLIARQGDLDPASIIGDGIADCDRIVFLWGLDAPAPEATTVASLLDARGWTTDFTVKLVQALVGAKLDAPPPLWIVTRGAQPAGDKHQQNVAAATLWGLGRVISLEQPDVWGGLVDLPPASGTEVVPRLVAELLDAEGEDQIALRGDDQRFAPRLIPSDQENVPLRPYRAKSEGVYLITGGMGGLGLTVAKWLVEQGARHLAITGRSKFPDRSTWGDAGHNDATRTRIAAISELEALGARVDVLQAGVTDAARMTEIVQALNAEPGGLIGAVHAAGISRPQDMMEIDLETFNSVLIPKVEGAWLLHELTKAIDLEIFVMFSSIASVWGSQHIASYCTANHFLDALGHHRGALGLAGISVNWGPWLVDSDLADQEVLDFLQALGLQPFDAPQGTEIMGHLAQDRSISQMVVSGVDWSVFKMVYEARGARPLLEHIKIGSSSGGLSDEKSQTLLDLEAAEPEARHGIVQAFLCGQVADIMRLEPEAVDMDSDVVELGVDSLMVMEVIKCCKSGLQITILPKDLFERPSVNQWSTYVTEVVATTHHLPAAAPQAPADGDSEAPKASGDKPPTDTGPDWTTPRSLVPEVKLAEDVRPAAGATVEPLHDPSSLLLTGGTGFVGAFLTRELLAQTEAKIYCLVRAEDAEAAKVRLRQTFEKYELEWTDQAEARVIAIVGDLGLPRFGLDQAAYEGLGRRVEGIFHVGAIVNFSLTYEQSYAANVTGTEEVLRLAVTGPLKPVHYVSTYGLWGIADDPYTKYMEDDDIITAGRLINGYVQTKWVAEKVVFLARDRGVPVNTYRLGRIMGDVERGVGLTTSLTCAILKGCIQLGLAPKFGDHLVEMTPVDWCCQSMVHIAKAATSLGTTFHVINPTRITFGELVEYMQKRGYPIDIVSPRAWHQGLLDTLGTDQVNELHPLVDAVEEVLDNPDDAVVYDMQHVLDALAGTSIICPPIDHRLLDTYFSYFTRSGWLPEPPTKEH